MSGRARARGRNERRSPTGEISGIERALAAPGFVLDDAPIADQTPVADSRFEALVERTEHLLLAGGELRDDERLIVFTENKATLDYVARRSRERYPADRVLARRRPRGGRSQLWRVLRELLDHVDPWTRDVSQSDPRAAIHELEAWRGHRLVVFLISDLLDRDVPEDLKYLRPRHDVSVVHLYDPFEFAAIDEVILPLYAPEGEVATAPRRLGGDAPLAAVQEKLRSACAERRISFASISTADEVPPGLIRLFLDKARGGR